ncbi:MAG: c-type cytochrome [Deltaproteobacteria bacterium]|nr:c-type cytochrome [Deltaproteobacteria bacterium]
MQPKQFFAFFFFLLIFASCRSREAQPTNEEHGNRLYEAHCASCHGAKGNGNGPAAPYLWPKPRDFTAGVFKYRTTRGPYPSDTELLETMKKGIPGTSMPGWDILKTNDWRDILATVKRFIPHIEDSAAGPYIEVPVEAKATLESIEEGKKLYETAGCPACHGPQGHGDGPAAQILRDIWGQTISPRDLTHGPLKWGNLNKEIYRTLLMGIPGTPMPAHEGTFTPAQIWSLVHYIKAIQKMPADYNPSDPKRYLIDVVQIDGELPDDPAANAWQKAKGVPVFLKPLYSAPNIPEWLTVKALSNGKETAFYISWEDDLPDMKEGRSDGVAVQLPTKEISDPSELPYLGMGHSGNPVEIWKWEPGGLRRFASNGIGTPLTLLPSEAEKVHEKGAYDNGRWHVILKSSSFKSGGYLSFALWDADIMSHAGPETFSEWMQYSPSAEGD